MLSLNNSIGKNYYSQIAIFSNGIKLFFEERISDVF